MSKGYKHLDRDQRMKLEALLEARLSKSKIAEQLKCARSTIYREIKRGLYERNVEWNFELHYSADIGQKIHDENATAKGAPLKIGNDWDFVKYVEDKIIDEKYSPDAIIGRIKYEGLKFKGMVSTRTIYNYIDDGNIFPNVTRESLFMKGKRKRNYDKVKPVRIKKPLRRGIEERPKDIDKREEFGHWEMDTVKGKRNGKKPVLLVLTERKGRTEIIRKLDAGTTELVVAELDKIEREMLSSFSRCFKSITIDNGSEFYDDKNIERSLFGGTRTTVYYCHPSCPSERGSNENANKLIRRFIPKGAEIADYSDEYITHVQDWINKYPRRILGYSTPLEEMQRDLGFSV